MPYYRNTYTPRKIDRKYGSVTRKNAKGRYTQLCDYNSVYGWSDSPSEGRDVNYVGGPHHNEPPFLSEWNRLYDKIQDVINGPKGELLTSAVEWKSSLDMITKRAVQMRLAYSAIRKGNIAKAARILDLTEPPKGARKKKERGQQSSASTSVWLEYWMGWAPLAGDIGNAIETLTLRPPPLNEHFSVGVKASLPYRKVIGDPLDWRLYEVWDGSFEGKLSAFGKFQITNHNLQLANQLGFTNPALTLWQVVPFSFIVDWFINIGQVIGSLTPYLGVTLKDTGTAVMMTSTFNVKSVWWDYDPKIGAVRYFNQSQTSWMMTKRRVIGSLPSPRLQARMLDRVSLTRAATSISLLVEIFLRKK